MADHLYLTEQARHRLFEPSVDLAFIVDGSDWFALSRRPNQGQSGARTNSRSCVWRSTRDDRGEVRLCPWRKSSRRTHLGQRWSGWRHRNRQRSRTSRCLSGQAWARRARWEHRLGARPVPQSAKRAARRRLRHLSARCYRPWSSLLRGQRWAAVASLAAAARLILPPLNTSAAGSGSVWAIRRHRPGPPPRHGARPRHSKWRTPPRPHLPNSLLELQVRCDENAVRVLEPGNEVVSALVPSIRRGFECLVDDLT